MVPGVTVNFFLGHPVIIVKTSRYVDDIKVSIKNKLLNVIKLYLMNHG